MAGNGETTAHHEEKEPRKIDEKVSDGKEFFCLNDYDCIGFDMDHTLIYRSFAKYLVHIKGYDKHLLDEDFLKYEDYSLRGLTFEVAKGNFLKLDENGYILRACHGMQPMSDEEITAVYGKERMWKSFPELKEKVHHGSTFKCFENFFDMPIGVLSARIVDIIDEKNGRPLKYDFWVDMIEALNNSFGPSCFTEHKGYFFTSIKAAADNCVKKCPENVIKWLKYLKESGKVIFLLTQSHVGYTKFLMQFAIGDDWMDLFDFVLTDGKKPEFFKPSNKRPFTTTEDNGYDRAIEDLETKKCYAHGSAFILEKNAKRILGKDHVKVVYFGDSPKSDVAPPRKFCNWDTVAVLEEMEAEEVHFRKHSNCFPNGGGSNKKPRMIHHLLKEEKIIVASKQWGSFFRHDKDENENNCHEEIVNTFWGSVIKDYSKIAIPLLDYLTDLPIDYKFQCFSENQLGFYPGPPSTVVHEH